MPGGAGNELIAACAGFPINQKSQSKNILIIHSPLSKLLPLNREFPLKKKPRKIYISAMLTAVGVILGYLFLSIPNVELVTATVFIAGFFLGPLFGVLVGVVTEFIYSALNPMGMAAPNLLLAQILGMALAGYAGGKVQQNGWYKKSPLVQIIIFGTAGFLITLLFDVLTTLSFVFILSGGDLNKILSSFFVGMTFYVIHITVNTVIFAVLVPILISRLSQFINHE